VQQDACLLELSRYIGLNPVQASMARWIVTIPAMPSTY